MTCPKCNEGRLVTIDSRVTTENTTRRRKVCPVCGARLTTYEILDTVKARLEMAERWKANMSGKIEQLASEI